MPILGYARACLRASLLALAAIACPGVCALAFAAPPLHLHAARCASHCSGPSAVARGGSVAFEGAGMLTGLHAVFPIHPRHGHTHATVPTRFISASRLLARVPQDAISGPVYLVGAHGIRSNAAPGPGIVRSGRTAPPPAGGGPASSSGTSAFSGGGMWIWYVSHSSGGGAAGLLAQARAHGIATVFVKSSDGANYWGQFSSGLVRALKAGGLHVCAWQYVYGAAPATEAALGAAAARAGADCLVIDAEAEYEGRYASAATYISALRAAVGAGYPVGLASFPYVDYHPAFPYSVFLGPGGAQFDAPQVYWRDIGVSVDEALAHSYAINRPYGRTIAPIGQLYNGPSSSEIVRFRELAAANGASGVSWWDWENASATGWEAVGTATSRTSTAAAADASLGQGAKGDLVVWAQEHLLAAGQPVTVDGGFGQATARAVRSFQATARLAVTGVIDTATWDALLRHTPSAPAWARAKLKLSAALAGARRTGPASAGLPARRYEIPRHPVG